VKAYTYSLFSHFLQGPLIVTYPLSGITQHKDGFSLYQSLLKRKQAFCISSKKGTPKVELFSLPVGTRMAVGPEVILEISQTGKTCHTGCAVCQQMGKCIWPVEGVFATVISGGIIKTGDNLVLE
jgi:hypothetical protein